ncbi:DKNYY domain-containing protein [Chryseobacterium sp. SSA4.19]|uniref:DKNYY domain-containing protein n=1 Tax=Chryseobacterium sp. SSA4.19 TaxID=2919915 RepID=UPI001F4E1B11|nr:DKNYY domain-containing protein [Chryseobacterium sp. SSA4.19]MCJ8154834.1 DKNYY domain-containing protein [Chryseobacterium sp. SSA4.19]
MYKYRYLFYTVLGILVVSAGTLVYSLMSDPDPAPDFEQKKTDLNGVFSVYNGKVYALVPGNGYYEVSGARPGTFKPLEGEYNDSHIGYDGQHVYAGNRVLEGLQPAKTVALGNNYYSDGKVTYYVDRNSERNEALGTFGFLVQTVGYRFHWTDKPQNYGYPVVRLPAGRYHAVLNYAVAVNGQQSFFKGLPMPKADPHTMHALPIRFSDRSERESIDYFTDGRHVYYRDQLLPLAYHPGLYETGIEGDVASRNAYLTDQQNGMVYVDGHSFAPEPSPYRLLSADSEHANHILWLSPKGIYFYNAETEEQERAGDTPFQGKHPEELAPDVFRSGDAVYYLSASESWARKSGLQSRSTHLNRLENIRASGLQKVRSGSPDHSRVWKSGSRYFYFDDLGSSQLLPSAIYEIKEADVIQKLMDADDLGSDEVRSLLSDGKLTEPDHDTLVTASTEYNRHTNAFYWIAGGVVVFILLFALLGRIQVDPFTVKGGYLIVNNLFFKKYKLTDIQKVVFGVSVPVMSRGGALGKMQVVLSNGKRSRNYTFSSRIKLLPESQYELKSYIQKLQARLRQYGIKSELEK